MTMPVRVRVPSDRAAPRPAAAAPAVAQPARPVRTAVSARTAAAFSLPALQQGSTAPQTLGDEAGSVGGVPLTPGPPRIAGPPAVAQTILSGPQPPAPSVPPSLAKIQLV